MIILSKMADYAVSLMVVMAEVPNDLHSAQRLAHMTSLPRPTVGNLLKKLAQAGLVRSVRGATGGYGLAQQPDDISVAAIIAAIDGPLGFTECSENADDHSNCERAGFCTTRPHWQYLTRAVNRAMADVSLTDMMPRHTALFHRFMGDFVTGQAASR